MAAIILYTCYVSAAAASVVTTHILYQNTSVYHCISFRNKLTAYRGASDQFDLKLECAASNAESNEVKVVCQNEVKLFVRSRSIVIRGQCQVVWSEREAIKKFRSQVKTHVVAESSDDFIWIRMDCWHIQWRWWLKNVKLRVPDMGLLQWEEVRAVGGPH